ncbi:MAG: hypothetical protein ACJAYU_005449 [Bradymonadia bacterium]|jgi:hypothetical protein
MKVPTAALFVALGTLSAGCPVGDIATQPVLDTSTDADTDADADAGSDNDADTVSASESLDDDARLGALRVPSELVRA